MIARDEKSRVHANKDANSADSQADNLTEIIDLLLSGRINEIWMHSWGWQQAWAGGSQIGGF